MNRKYKEKLDFFFLKKKRINKQGVRKLSTRSKRNERQLQKRVCILRTSSKKVKENLKKKKKKGIQMKIVSKIKNKKQKRQMEDQMEFLIILN